MDIIVAFLVAHQLIIFYLFAGAVERLPAPDATSSKQYAYAYSLLQFIAANTKRSQDAVAVARTPKP
jgi:hypothetical protein